MSKQRRHKSESYFAPGDSNVVGLPLVEFIDLLRDPLFEGRVELRMAASSPAEITSVPKGVPVLKVVSVGDINYDLGFTKLACGFFSGLRPPGAHVEGELYRGTGGTAAVFAQRALEAGFKQSSVLGVIGGDALGKFIEAGLHSRGITPLLPADYKRRTGIALVLREEAENDTLLTITDSYQALSEDDIDLDALTIGCGS